MDRLTDFFKVLSDETRLRILVLLFHKKLCVCQICGIMNESQPKISKHLAKLRDMGFVNDERSEQFIYYTLNLNNELYANILINIVKSVSKYDRLRNDIERIKFAEKYLDSCKR